MSSDRSSRNGVTGNATTPPYFARNSSGFVIVQNLLLLFPKFITASVFLIGLGELLCLFARGFRFIVTNRPHAVFFYEANDARVEVTQPLPVEIVRDRIAGIAFVSEPARFLVIIRHMADDQVFTIGGRFERGDELFDIIPFPLSARIVPGAGQVRKRLADAARINDALAVTPRSELFGQSGHALDRAHVQIGVFDVEAQTTGAVELRLQLN